MIYKASPIFDNANPIIMKVTFSFRKKISSFHKSIHKIQQILQPKTWKTTPFLTTTIQKLLKQLLAFINFYQHTKNQFIPLISS